jgi:hypothetical protein
MCTVHFGQFIGSTGATDEKKIIKDEIIKAVMGVEQTAKITTVYI